MKIKLLILSICLTISTYSYSQNDSILHVYHADQIINKKYNINLTYEIYHNTSYINISIDKGNNQKFLILDKDSKNKFIDILNKTIDIYNTYKDKESDYIADIDSMRCSGGFMLDSTPFFDNSTIILVSYSHFKIGKTYKNMILLYVSKMYMRVNNNTDSNKKSHIFYTESTGLFLNDIGIKELINGLK